MPLATLNTTYYNGTVVTPTALNTISDDLNFHSNHSFWVAPEDMTSLTATYTPRSGATASYWAATGAQTVFCPITPYFVATGGTSSGVQRITTIVSYVYVATGAGTTATLNKTYGMSSAPPVPLALSEATASSSGSGSVKLVTMSGLTADVSADNFYTLSIAMGANGDQLYGVKVTYAIIAT